MKIIILLALTVTLSASASLAQVPLLHSRPAATKKIFLDFFGDPNLNTWKDWRPQTAPAHVFQNLGPKDAQGNHTGPDGVPPFNSATYPHLMANETERGILIGDIWAMVAERFSMYDVDVTTDAAALSAVEHIRVIFDDSSTHWPAHGNGGVFGGAASYQAEDALTFTDTVSYWEVPSSNPNKPDPYVFVWEEAAGGDDWPHAHRLAWTAAHEVGHMLGFGFDFGASTTVQFAIIGPSVRGQGVAPGLTRRWGWAWNRDPNFLLSNGDNFCERNLKSLMANIGARAEEEADVASSAAYLGTLGWSEATFHGVIDRHGDADWFAFELDHTDVQLEFNVQVEPQLMALGCVPYISPHDCVWFHAVDTRIELYDSQMNLLDASDPPGEDPVGWTPKITYQPYGNEGTYGLYYLKVESAETDGPRLHGDLGQYVIEATFD